MKRRLVLLLLALLLAALACAPRQTTDEQRSLASLRQVDDHPLYVMTYYGDYGFSQFLKSGRRATALDLQRQDGAGGRASQSAAPRPASAPGWLCTCFWAYNDGSPLFGRNFDWERHPALLLFTDPPDGYASVSMVDAGYLDLGSDPLSVSERLKFLDAPYWPFDGVNECGVAVGVMAVPYGEARQDPELVTIGSLHVVRLLLDRATNLHEALWLLQQYNVDWGSGPPLHYLLADRERSVVIEYASRQRRAMFNTDAWQVSTNFLISEVCESKPDDLCERYREANAALAQAQGRLSSAAAMALLSRVSQPITQWSAVYELGTGTVRVAMGREYGEVQEFELGMK